MAWSSKVLILLVVISLTTTPGQCQQFRTNTSSRSSRTSPVVTTLSIVGAIVGFIAFFVPVCIVICYRANQQRRREFYAAPSQAQAVYSSYSSTTTQQQAPTVVYNASYSQYHSSAGTSGQRQYQSRVLYDINHQSRSSAPQDTRYVY